MSLLWVPVYLFLQMCLVWVLARRLNNMSVVDVFWGIGLVVAGWITLWPVTQNARVFIAMMLLLLWGLRLSGFLVWTRLRWNQVDKRYAPFEANRFVHFQVQALLMWVIASVFICARTALLDTITWMDIVAYGVIVLGIMGETMADIQLLMFKKKNPNAVCQQGWWRLSRHPNTFFDWLTWCGFFMFAAQSPYGWLGMISPLTLYYVMNFITNPLTEKMSLEKRGDAYREYQRKTSAFFPMKPSRSSAVE